MSTLANPLGSYLSGYLAADDMIANNKRLKSQLRSEELNRALNLQTYDLNQQLNPLKVASEQRRDALDRYTLGDTSAVPSTAPAVREVEARVGGLESTRTAGDLRNADLLMMYGVVQPFVNLLETQGKTINRVDQNGLEYTDLYGNTISQTWDELARANPETHRRAIETAQAQMRIAGSGGPGGGIPPLSSQFGIANPPAAAAGVVVPGSTGSPMGDMLGAAPTPAAPAAPTAAPAAPTTGFDPTMLYQNSRYVPPISDFLQGRSNSTTSFAVAPMPASNQRVPFLDPTTKQNAIETLANYRNDPLAAVATLPTVAMFNRTRPGPTEGPVMYNGQQLSNQPTLDFTPQMLQRAVEKVESGGNPYAVSPKGAIGPMQVMPETAAKPGFEEFGMTDIFSIADRLGIPYPDRSRNSAIALNTNPAVNREFGWNYFTAMLNRFGDMDAALAAYNMGPGALQAHLAANNDQLVLDKLPEETRNYIPRVRAALAQMVQQSQQDAMTAYQ